MRPAIEPGDWLLVDPTVTRWPRRGSVVVFREPDGEALAVKRVAAGPGDRVPFADGLPRARRGRGLAAERRDGRRDRRGRVRRADRLAPLRPGPARPARRVGPGSATGRSRRIGRIGRAASSAVERAPRSTRPPARARAAGRPRGSPRRTPPAPRRVGDQRVGKQTIRSSPIVARARAEDVDPGLAGVAASASSRAYSENRERGRVAALGLAACADLGHPLGDLVGDRGTRRLSSSRVADRVAGRHAAGRCRRR